MRRPGRTAASLLLAVLVGTFGLAGCGDDEEDETATPSGSGSEAAADEGSTDEGNVLRVEELDYGYDISGSLREGWTTIEASNSGDEYHMMGVGRMKEGVTLEQIQDTLSEMGGGEEAPPEGESLGTIRLASQEGEGEGEGEGEDPFAMFFEEEIGAPGHILAPGASVAITTDALVAGDYAVICFIETPDGEPHFAKGMINEFTVEESDEGGEEPQADFEVAFGDGDAAGLPSEIPAGEATFALTGAEAGPEEHEFAVIRADSATITREELDVHFDSFDDGVPPTRDTLDEGPGIIDVYLFDYPSNTRVFVKLDLPAGTSWLGCGLEDEADPPQDHADTELKQVAVT